MDFFETEFSQHDRALVDLNIRVLDLRPLTSDVPGSDAENDDILHVIEGLNWDTERTTNGPTNNRLLKKVHAMGGGWCIRPSFGLSEQATSNYFRFKPEFPPADWKTGKPQKYLGAIDVSPRAYLPTPTAEIWQRIADRYQVPMEGDSFGDWLLDHAEIPVVITEGEKKALAALALGYATVSLPGIDCGYSSRSEREDGGDRQLFLIPDLEALAAGGRKIHVAFDRDSAPKTVKRVQAARRRLAELLSEHGAETNSVLWPAEYKGLDDFIFGAGGSALDGAIANAVNITPKPRPDGEGSSGAENKENLADKARQIAESRCEFFHSSDGIAYTDIIIDGHRHTYPVRSRRFRLWLTNEFLNDHDRGINSQSMQDCLCALESIALFRNPERAVHLRKAELDGKIYIDLGGDDWSAIEVDAVGWRIVATPPVRFWRPETSLPLPTPTYGGKLEDLRELLNVDNDSWVLISTFLLFCFCPSDVYPVLVLFAPRGSGKTTAAEVLKDLVDPGKGGLLDLPTDSRALAVNAIRRSLLVYDNVSYIGNDSSDLVCKVATGFSLGVRTLHTDNEETTFDILRPQIITAIDAIVTRDDLADRVLMAQLLPISEEKRLPQAEVRARIEELKPGILGALMTALSQSLANLPDTRAKATAFPRLADYALFATAAEESIGLDDGQFREVFDRSREESRQIVIEASPVAEAIVALVRAELVWRGTPTELLNKLEQYARQEVVKSRSWPKGASALSPKVNRLRPDLEHVGISITDFREPGTGVRKFTIEKSLQLPANFRATDSHEETLSHLSRLSKDIADKDPSRDGSCDSLEVPSGSRDSSEGGKGEAVTESSQPDPLPRRDCDGHDSRDGKNPCFSSADEKAGKRSKTPIEKPEEI